MALIIQEVVEAYHGGIIPAKTWKSPFKVNVAIWVLSQGVPDEVIHAPKHLSLLTLLSLEDESAFGS